MKFCVLWEEFCFAKFFEVGKLNFRSIVVTKAHHIFAYSLRQGKEWASNAIQRGAKLYARL